MTGVDAVVVSGGHQSVGGKRIRSGGGRKGRGARVTEGA